MNWRTCVLAAILTAIAVAQDAQISGLILDPSQARVVGADIALRNEQTGGRRNTRSNEAGYYSFSALRPGLYRLTVRASDFETVVREAIILEVGQSARLDISLRIGDPRTTITVYAGPPSVSLEDAAVGTVIDRNLIEEMPLNGRGIQMLIELTPGVDAIPVSERSRGQFSINGQRSDANYFTVDGISVNFAAPNSQTRNSSPRSAPATSGQAGGGMLPAHNFLGTFSNLLAPDAVQEFKIRTSTYAPESGHLPGGQVDLVSCSGGNRYSGSLFEYVRNDRTDANDWFNNAQGLRTPPLRFNNLGGSLGGPVRLGRWYDGRDRTFFFLSVDQLLVSQPQQAVPFLLVPSAEARQNSPAGLAQLLSVFPLPTGPAVDSVFFPATQYPGFGAYTKSYSRQYFQRSLGLRIDQVLPKNINLFARVNHAPATRVEPLATTAAANRETYRLDTNTLTLGATQVFTPNLVNELRFGWSRQRTVDSTGVDPSSGGKNPDDLQIFPPGYSSADSFLLITVQPLSFADLGLVEKNHASQLQLLDNLFYARGPHRWKFGGEYRAFRTGSIEPKIAANIGLAAIYNADRSFVSTTTGVSTSFHPEPEIAYLEPSFSAYAQDTWRLSDSFTMTYGVRWEAAVAPRTTAGRAFAIGGLTDLNDPSTGFVVPQEKPFYPAMWGNFAPRVGLGWRMFGGSSKPTVLRVGAGRFFGSAQAGFEDDNARILSKLSIYQNSSTTSLFSGTPTVQNGPLRLTAVAAAPNYRLPVTYQWNATVEQVLGAQTVSIGYVGAAGERLLGSVTALPGVSNGFQVHLVGNDGSSSYHSMQVQFNRRLTRRLRVLASYTWSHSIDNLSNDVSGPLLPSSLDQYLNPDRNRGPSDFDIRHSLNGAVIAELPSPRYGIWARAFGHWSAQTIFFARSALPTDVLSLTLTGARPNYLYGQPLYLYGSQYPGGKRFNPDALVDVGLEQNGNLGRNVFRGFGAWEIDFALHRDIHVAERARLQLRLEAFNILNHPNFANPIEIADAGQNGRLFFAPGPRFGVASEMLSTGLGPSLIPGELNPLFQIGGPRVLQFGIRLLF